MRITVPGLPPSVNHCYFTDSRGRRLLTEKAKAYVELVGWESKNALLAQRWAKEGKWLRLSIKIFFPDFRRRDTHNCIKLLADGIAKGIDVDDSAFLIHEEIPEVDKANPRVIVTIEEAAND